MSKRIITLTWSNVAVGNERNLDELVTKFRRLDQSPSRLTIVCSKLERARQRGEGLPTTITPSLSPPPLHHRCPLYTTGVNDGSFPSHSLDLRQENRSWRRERYWGVPLCAIDCELWFTACANDVTCTDNWTNNFRWLNMTGDCPTKGSCLTNYCPVNSTCQTFKEIYRTARNFCEKVWDNAWKYAEPTTPCMHLQFNQSAINPNDAVALHYTQIIAGSQMHSCNLMWFSIQLAVWAFINRILTVAS
nr:folate receptor beta-like [Procambarus clarkii]